MSPSRSSDGQPFRPSTPHPGPHPSPVATAHARQGPHCGQHQLKPFSVHKLQKQGHSVVLEDPFSPCFFTAQYNEVVGSLKEGRENEGGEEGLAAEALATGQMQGLVQELDLQNIFIFFPPIILLLETQPNTIIQKKDTVTCIKTNLMKYTAIVTDK